MSERLRIDVWLWRVRLAKSRTLAANLVGGGNVRVIRDGASRRLDKPSAEVAPGDAVVLVLRGTVRAYRVAALPQRRGPAREAALCYCELDAEALG